MGDLHVKQVLLIKETSFLNNDKIGTLQLLTSALSSILIQLHHYS